MAYGLDLGETVYTAPKYITRPKENTGELVGGNTAVTQSLGNNNGYMYTGTSGGKPYIGTDLSKVDAGSVTGASIDGTTFGGDNLMPKQTNWYDGFSKDGGLLGASQVGLGIGQLGLGLANYFDAADTSKLNRQLMNQQIANNKVTMADREANKAAMEKVFAPRAPGGGLAQLATSRGV